MDGALDLVAFVTRSENRVRALRGLADGPATRPELQADTGVARPTLSRILADFRDRDLVERETHRYALTPLGRFVASELGALLESVEEMAALQALAGWLPLDDLGVDLADLGDVTVALPTPADPLAPVKRAARVIEDVGDVRAFCYSVVHAPILAECRNVTDRGHRFVGVVASDVFRVVADDPELAGRLRELLANGAAEVYLHEGAIEPQLILAGDRTMFLVTDDEGAIQGLVEVGDPAVQRWARETFEAVRAAAEPLEADRADELLTA